MSIETVLAFDGQESKQMSKIVAKKQACQEILIVSCSYVGIVDLCPGFGLFST
jgi:hypothetical protein